MRTGECADLELSGLVVLVWVNCQSVVGDLPLVVICTGLIDRRNIALDFRITRLHMVSSSLSRLAGTNIEVLGEDWENEYI